MNDFIEVDDDYLSDDDEYFRPRASTWPRIDRFGIADHCDELIIEPKNFSPSGSTLTSTMSNFSDASESDSTTSNVNSNRKRILDFEVPDNSFCQKRQKLSVDEVDIDDDHDSGIVPEADEPESKNYQVAWVETEPGVTVLMALPTPLMMKDQIFEKVNYRDACCQTDEELEPVSTPANLTAVSASIPTAATMNAIRISCLVTNYLDSLREK